MSEHNAEVRWYRNTASFAYEDYDRRHEWRFDGGVDIPASAAKGFLGDPACVDPEEAFVASLAACHMLTFLAIASRRRIVVDSYVDRASGVLEKNPEGRLAVTRVTLRPRVRFGGASLPSDAEIARMHTRSHEECFIANSVTTRITVEPSQ